MRGSEEKRFRKRLLALLLCAVVTCQSFLPVANNLVFAAEVPEAAAGAEVLPKVQTGAQPVEEAAEQPAPVAGPAQAGAVEEQAEATAAKNDAVPEEAAAEAEEAGAGEAITGEYPDPAKYTVDSGNLTDYFTSEEIAEAEAFYKGTEAEADPEPTEAELKAEEAEKERERAEAEKYLVDDSAKLLNPGDEGAEGEEASGASEWTNKIRWNDKTFILTFNDAIKLAAYSSDYPLFLVQNMAINKTAFIPDNRTVTIYLCGYDIYGSSLGSNPLFRLGKGSTLRILGRGDERLYNGGDGAIVARDGSTLTLKNLKITGNKADRNGGGIYLDGQVKCELFNVEINDNKAGKCGGGIFVNGKLSNIYMDANSRVYLNKASAGGGIYIDAGKVNIYGPAVGKARIEHNSAETGGGLYFNASDIKGSGLIINNNSATSGHGGGVRMDKTGTSLADVEIRDNESSKNGGGVYINGKVGTLTDAYVHNNRCGEGYHGGGIYVDSMDNLGSGGKFIVTNNMEASGSDHDDDLYLQNGKKTDAYLHAALYSPGSKIGIGVTDWKEGQRITFEPGNFNPKFFYCNNWIARDKHKNNNVEFFVAAGSSGHLILTQNRETALLANRSSLLNRNEKKSVTEKSGSYVTHKDGNSYDLWYGYASSPSHTNENKDIVNKYFYSDGYFFEDPAYYNPHLSTFGMNLAMASADSNVGSHSDYNYKFDNVKSMLKGIGCKEEDIYISPSYIVKPTDSSIGFAIGHKKILDTKYNIEYTLVPIAIRSYGYEKEWASNMTLTAGNTTGNRDEASGFKDARTKVMNGIKNYISNYGLEGQLSQGRVKFFLVGFSRGSATANLTSKALVDTYGTLSEKYKNNPNQVFGYCYAVPAGGTDDCDTALKKNGKDYYCIHNIINKVDLTPMVAPKEMGFKRYGVDHFVPGDDAGNVKKSVQLGNEGNGFPKYTVFWDNNPWYTGSPYYQVKRPAMLKQLRNVNDDIFFSDQFRETDLIVGKAEGTKHFFKGLFTESSPVKFEPVKNSATTIESWLPDFYEKVQNYFTVGEKERLTRKSYSGTVIRAGKRERKKLSKGEKFWYEKGATAQDTFRGLVQMLLSKTPAEKANLGAAFSGMFNKIGLAEILVLYEKLVNSKHGWDYSYARQQDYLDLLWNKLKDNRYGQKAIQDALTPDELRDMENYYPALMSIVFRIVRQDFNEKGHSGKMRLAGTFAKNTETILQGHVPEIALAWLRAYDDYYTSSQENTAYYWGKETKSFNPTVTMTVSDEDVTQGGTHEYTGDQKLKLESAVNNGIYYKVWMEGENDAETKKNEAGAVTRLYNEKQGVLLKAPDAGSEEHYLYKIKTWAKNSWADDADKVVLKTGPVKTSGQIRINAPDKKENCVSYNIIVRTYNADGTPKDTQKGWVDTGLAWKPGQEVTFKLMDYIRNIDDSEDDDEIDLNKYYIRSWETENSTDHSIPRRYRINENGTDRVSLKGESAADYKVKVYFYPRISGWNIDQTAMNDLTPKPGERPRTLSYKDVTVKYANNDGWVKSADGLRTAWQVRDGNKFVKVPYVGGFLSTKYKEFEYNKEYRAVLSVYDYRAGSYGEKNPTGFKYQDTVSVNIGNNKYTLNPYKGKNRGCAEVYYEYPPTYELIKVTDCRAKDSEIWIWRSDNKDTMREVIKKSLPKYAGTIVTEKKTVSGLQVNWETGSGSAEITDEKLNSDRFQVYGYLTGSGADEFKNEKYDWGDFGDRAFRVDAWVNIVDPTNLAPPAPDVLSGNYNLVYDELPMDDKRNVLISLENPNVGIDGVSMEYKKWETGDEPVSYNAYSDPIKLEVAEGETKTFNLKVSCNTTVSGWLPSKPKTYTYEITKPAIHSVYAYVRDINDLDEGKDADYRKNATVILASVSGDEALIDYDSLVEDDEDRYDYDFVSWNKLTVLSDNGIIKEQVSDNLILHRISDNDVYYEALNAPVLGAAELEIDSPATGFGLPDVPDSISLHIGGDPYDIDPSSVSVNWTASENSTDDGMTRSGTTYTARIALSADTLRYYDKDSESYQPLDLKFMPDRNEDFSILVNDVEMVEVSGNEAQIEDIDYDCEYDESGVLNCFNVYVTFEKTGTCTFFAVEPPEGLSVSFNAATFNNKTRFESDVVPKLPKEAEVLVDDGSVQTLPVSWNFALNEEVYDEQGREIWKVEKGVAYEKFGYVVSADDLNTLDEWSLSLNGFVELPKGMKYDEGNPDIVSENDAVHCYFDYPVFMEGAPETNMPEILPQSGEYEPSTQNLIVEFNTFPVGESSNSVDVYYKITYHRFEDEDDDDDEDDEGISPDAPAWYDEDGKLVIPSEEEGTYKYIPFTGVEKDGKEELENRRITRADAEGYDYVKVTAVALEKGAYKLSNLSEEIYEFLPKPTAEIPDETFEKVTSLELTAGKALQTLKLPEGCRWGVDTDIWEAKEGYAGDYVDATVVYNNDPVNYNDLILRVKILLTAGFYDITAENCKASLIDETEGVYPEDWKRVTNAQAESEIFVSANEAENGKVLYDWVITDGNGDEISWETFEEGEDADLGMIRFIMPYSDVRIRPLYADTTRPVASVTSLILDKTSIELKKGGSETLTATAQFGDEGDRPEISFKSSNPNVATVTATDAGVAKITAVSSGSATIWVDCGQKTAACKVYVGFTYLDVQLTNCKAYDITGGTEQPLTDIAVKGATVRLVADPPKNPTDVFKEWTLNYPHFEKLTENEVKFTLNTDLVARPEYMTDPAYEDPGEYAYKNVKIKSLAITDPASKKKITKLTASLNGLTTVDAKAVYKNDTDMPPIVFKSSNTDVAKVKTVSGQNPGEAQCVIAGCRPGVVTVTAYCGNKTARLTVTVGDEEVETIKLFGERLENSTEKIDGQYVLELQTGEQELLSASPYDDFNTTPIKVTWKSDDPKIATVRNGLVTARIADKGHTTVTAQAKVKPYGSNKWINLPPAKVVVRVKAIEVPKKARNDKSYNLSLKASQNLDLTAAKIGKKNVISGCTVTAKLKGTKPETLEWKSTNESIVSVNAKEDDPLSAEILAKGIGTAYVVLEGTNAGSNLTNRAVMKITVKSTAPDIEFTNDTLGALSDDYTTLTLKQGSYDRLAVNITCPVPGDTSVTSNVSEKITWSGSGGVTVTDGVVFAKNLSKNGKAAKVTVKCGKSKKELNVIVK